MLEKLIRNGEIFFFAGSGISYLSHMVSAGDVLHRTAQLFFPSGKDWARLVELIVSGPSSYRIQPEVFYERILDLSGSVEALSLWKSLSPHCLQLHNLNSAPNINHLFIAKYSFEKGIPIFTTNFDCLFEKAAEELGYDYRVVLPSAGSAGGREALEEKGMSRKKPLAIFKLHGSIADANGDTLENLFTTMRAISSTNKPILELLHEMRRNKHIVFVGYSGRDIDYFPEIARQDSVRQSFWLDHFRDPSTLRSAKRTNAHKIHQYPNEIFEKMQPDLVRMLRAPAAAEVEVLFEKLSNEVRRVYFSEEKKILLLAMCLHSVGRHRESLLVLRQQRQKLLDELDDSGKLIYLHTCSRLLDCVSKYVDSEHEARRALRYATRLSRDKTLSSERREDYRMIRVLALHQATLAKKMQLGPTIRYGGCLDYRPSSTDILLMLLRYTWVVLHMKLLLRSSYPARDRETRGFLSTGPDLGFAIRAWNSYLDHEIVLFAFVEEACRRLRFVKLRLVRRILTHWLEGFESKSSEIGDYFTKSNVRKYRSIMLGQDYVGEAVDIYRLLNDPLNEALVHIGSGRRLLIGAASDPSNVKCAQEEFKVAYKLALRCGSYATALKAMVGLYYSESPMGKKRVRYARLKNQIQGAGYAKYLAHVESIADQ